MRCDYCDVRWHRSDLRMNAEGFLACPDDYDGRTGRELDALRADAAADSAVINTNVRAG